jgi:hypothetical protein
MWRGALVLLCLAALSYVLYFHRLGSLLPGYSAPELATYQGASNWHTVIANPINLPYTASVWLLTAVLHQGILMTRVVAAACGVVAGLLFFAVARLRYSFFIALLGTVLFTTSTGFLHTARYGTGQVLQMGILALIAAILAYRRLDERRTLADYALVALLALLWYIPGLIWFELFAGFVLFPGLRRQLRETAKPQLLGLIATALVIAGPLLVAIAHQPHVLLTTLGLPAQLHDLSHSADNLLHAVLAIAVRSDGSPLLWVGHAPLLSVTECVLGLIGAYVYLWRNRGRSGLLLGGDVIISLVLISLGGLVEYATLVPLLYLFILAGINYLLRLWFRVFPRNPIARGVGVVAICAMLAFAVLYQVRSYFVAWPHHTATRQAFRLPQP